MSQVLLTRDPIAVDAMLRAVASHASGATLLFLGTVRDVNDGRAVTGIDYSAYETMAESEMRRITDEAERAFPGIRLALTHRVGLLELGETSVAIAVSHAHRAPAMDATRYVIEELKRRVPIWKREHYADGTREWVDPAAIAGHGEAPRPAAHPVARPGEERSARSPREVAG